jgi:hypothetical protein
MSEKLVDDAGVGQKAMTKVPRAGTWWVSDSYGLARSLQNDGPRFVQSTRLPSKRRPIEGAYEPLLSPYEELFLRFARLADNGGLDDELDTDRNAAVALGWAEDYGVLGLTPTKEAGAWWGDSRGGPGDTVEAFAFEAWTANRTLRLYEAARREGGVDVETIAGIAQETQPPRYHGLIASTPGLARDWALAQAATNVQSRISRYAYPQLYMRASGAPVEGYGFANLLGALWLQAMWLLVANDVQQCKYPGCNRVITYEQPEKPLHHKKGERKPYKTRRDKDFCNNTCVQRNRRMNQRLHRVAEHEGLRKGTR